MQPLKIMLKKAYDIMFNGVKWNKNCIYCKNTTMKKNFKLMPIEAKA